MNKNISKILKTYLLLVLSMTLAITPLVKVYADETTEPTRETTLQKVAPTVTIKTSATKVTGTTVIDKRTEEIEYTIQYNFNINNYNGPLKLNVDNTFNAAPTEASISQIQGATYDSSKKMLSWVLDLGEVTTCDAEGTCTEKTIEGSYTYKITFENVPLTTSRLQNKVNAILPYSYIVTDEEGNETVTNGETKILSNKYAYTEINTTTINSYTFETTTPTLEDVTALFKYNLSYKYTITKYNGSATLTIYANLPYEIDTDASSYQVEGYTASYSSKRITWKKTIPSSNRCVTEDECTEEIVSDTFSFSVKYINATADKPIEAKSYASMSIGGLTKTTSTITARSAVPATVTMNYLDTEGNAIEGAPNTVINSYIGDTSLALNTYKKVSDMEALKYEYVSVCRVSGEECNNITSITVDAASIIINFYYSKFKVVTINYKDSNDNNVEGQESIILEVKKNTRITLANYKPDLTENKYSFTEVRFNGKKTTSSYVTITEAENTIDFIYDKYRTVTINYLDESGNAIEGTEQITFETTRGSKIAINDYKIDLTENKYTYDKTLLNGNSAPSTMTILEENNIINYIYAKYRHATINYKDPYGNTIEGTESVSLEVPKGQKILINDYLIDLSENKYALAYVKIGDNQLTSIYSTTFTNIVDDNTVIDYVYEKRLGDTFDVQTFIIGNDTPISTYEGYPYSETSRISSVSSLIGKAGIAKTVKATIKLNGTSYEATEYTGESIYNDTEVDFGTYGAPKFYFTNGEASVSMLFFNPHYVNEYEEKSVDFYYDFTDKDTEYTITVNYYFIDVNSIFNKTGTEQDTYFGENHHDAIPKYADSLVAEGKTSDETTGVIYFERETFNYKAGEEIDQEYKHNTITNLEGYGVMTELYSKGIDSLYIMPIQGKIGVDLSISCEIISEEGYHHGSKICGTMIHSDIVIDAFYGKAPIIVVNHIYTDKNGTETQLTDEIVIDDYHYARNDTEEYYKRPIYRIPTLYENTRIRFIGIKQAFDDPFFGESFDFGELQEFSSTAQGINVYGNGIWYSTNYINFYYVNNVGLIRVHHVDTEGTYISRDKNNEQVEYRQIIEGILDEEYEAHPITIYGYENIATNSTDFNGGDNEEIGIFTKYGKFTEDGFDIFFIYKEILGKVLVHHVDKDTNKDIEVLTLSGTLDETYKTESKEYTNYTLVEPLPTNKEGSYLEEDQEVFYYYLKDKGIVKVYYVDNKTGNQIENTYVELTGYVDETYETEEKTIDGYKFVRVDGVTQGNYPANATIEVTYYYDKQGKVIVHYYEIDTENELAESKELIGTIGDTYVTIPETINNYILEETPDNYTGPYQEEEQTVIYYYSKSGKLIVNYIDNLGNTLKDSIVTTKKVGTEYETDAVIIDDYTLNGTPNNWKGTYSEEDTIVNYIYTKNAEPVLGEGTVIVHHVDGTGAQIVDDVRLTGTEGTTYETSAIEKEGYTNVGHIGKTAGNFINGEIEVTYIYKEVEVPPVVEPEKGTLIVHYITINGTPLEKDNLTEEVVGTTYTLETKEFDNYELVSVIGKTSGVYTTGITEVTYIYKEVEVPPVVEQEKGILIIHYITINGTPLEKDNLTEEVVGTTYALETKEFDNYELVSVIGKTSGVYTNGTIEVTYIYKEVEVPPVIEPETGTVIIEHIKTDGTPLAYDEVITEKVGETYESSPLETEEYTLVSVSGNRSGTISKGTTYVIYIYKETNEEVTPEPVSNSGKVIVKYLTTEGRKLYLEDIVFEGPVGEAYESDQKSFEGYKFIFVDGQTQGKIELGTKYVLYLYQEITDEEDNNCNNNCCQQQCCQTQCCNNCSNQNDNQETVNGIVIAHYEDTEGNTINSDKTYKDSVGSNYATEKQLIENYKFLRVYGNTTGKFVDGVIEVTYVYEKLEEEQEEPKPVTGKVITYYHDTEGNIISDSKETEGEVGEPYFTEEKTIEGYKFKEVQGNKNGTYSETPIEVTYIYELIQETPVDPISEPTKGKVIVHYVDENRNPIANDELLNGEVGEEYIILTKTIDGYTFKEIEKPTPVLKMRLLRAIENNTGTFQEGTQEVYVVYTKEEQEEPDLGTVVVNYINTDGETISNSVEITKKVGDSYSTEELSFEEYTLVSTIGETSGNIKKGTTEVIYIYDKNIGTGEDDNQCVTCPKGIVLVRYEDEDHIILTDEITMEDFVNEPYTTVEKSFVGYTFKEIQGNKTGKFINGVINVTYVYTKNSEEEQEDETKLGKVNVVYINTKGEEISNRETIINEVGESYTTEEKEIDGYEFLNVFGEKVGTISDSEKTVIYIYDKQIGYGEDPEEEENIIKPPKTGYEPIKFNGLLTLINSLFALILLKRKNITIK